MNNKTQLIIDKYYPEGTRLRDIYISHCRSVADLAAEINERKHIGLNAELVESAAMLHDIGIFLTDADGICCYGKEPYIRHGILGAQLLRENGVDEQIAAVAERHTGAGITKQDIANMSLPLPSYDYTPRNPLERLICYADKFYSKTKLEQKKSLEKIRASMLRFSPETLARFDALHEEFGVSGFSRLVIGMSRV